MSERATIGGLIEAGYLEFGDGYRTKRSELSDEGFRIIRAADVANGSVRLDSPDFVDVSFARVIGKKVARSGDIVLTTKGTVGRVSMMPDTDEQVVYSPQLCYFRVLDDGAVSRRYLASWFKGREFWNQASHLMTNTDMAPYLNLADIRGLRITLPEIGEQRAIADVLGALEDKIAANTKLTATADEYLAGRFQSLPHDVLMPLSSTAQFVNGKAFTKGASGSGRVVVRIAELNSGIGGSTVLSDAEVDDKHLARPGDILFAWSGSLTLARWFRDEAIVNQHIFKVIPNPGFPKWLVYLLIRQKLSDFKAIAADKATTMGHIQRGHLDAPVHMPAAALVENVDAEMEAVWSRALLAEQENLTLAAMRDTLLPQLISGALRVREVERGAGELI